MANTKFTLSNGSTISVDENGSVWQGFVTVTAASVEVGDSIGPGCGLHTSVVTAKETE